VIVVLPFCSKDAALQQRNLEWCFQMAKGVDHAGLLSVEYGTDISKIYAIAECYFRMGVAVFEYVKPPSDKWPDAPNWAWQNTARHIYGSNLKGPWLWLEPDATPLIPFWIDAIEAEYIKGELPFMGHVLEMADGEHMNGVAVYPKDAVDYSTKAMLTRAAPWDVVLSKDALSCVHRANILFAHAPRYTGLTMSVTDIAVPAKLRQRGSVIFHGCNDGSLIDLLMGKVPKVNGGGKVYGLRDIDSKFDEAEVHWQKECARLGKLGHSVVPWKECRIHKPSIFDQTNWECGIFDALELTKSRVHFNPGLAMDMDGQRWLVTRRWDRTSDDKWHSTLCAYPMAKDCSLDVTRVVVLKFGTPPVIQQEDPRVIWHENHFHVAHCVWEKRRPYAGRQAVSRFTNEWKFVDTVFPRNGKNYSKEDSKEEGSEKNWVWFYHNDKWMFVYSFCPHIVCEINNPLSHKSPEPKLWHYGEIRGGTPPVLVDDICGLEGPQYLTFFHSSLPWKKKQRRYYMGAYTFEAMAPFRVTAITTQPLLCGSEEDTRINGGPLVVFPCGALSDDGTWLVTFGLNDEACGWIKIPFGQLEQRMIKCI